MPLKFKKMHGLGNDFIILDRRGQSHTLPRSELARLTHRKTGIGCDQIIPVEDPKHEEADVFMRILNAPGATEVQACGNATRCVASMFMKDNNTDEAVVQTVAGLLRCRAIDASKDMIEVDMGVPRLGWQEIPLSRECDTVELPIGEGGLLNPVAVNIGNPHGVFFVDDTESFPVTKWGPRFENDPVFPEKANIEFATVIDRHTIRMRVWERDTGETDACGSAACATMVAAVRRDLVERRCKVILNGGILDFHWREEDDHLFMTGPAEHVFDGEVEINTDIA